MDPTPATAGGRLLASSQCVAAADSSGELVFTGAELVNVGFAAQSVVTLPIEPSAATSWQVVVDNASLFSIPGGASLGPFTILNGDTVRFTCASGLVAGETYIASLIGYRIATSDPNFQILLPTGVLSQLSAPAPGGTTAVTIEDQPIDVVLDASALPVPVTLTPAALAILAPPNLTTTAMITVGFAAAMRASGGTPPYTWAVVAGAVPAGLSLSAAGHLTGTPTATGGSSFVVRVTDAAAATAEQDFGMVVLPLPSSGGAVPSWDSKLAVAITVPANTVTEIFRLALPRGETYIVTVRVLIQATTVPALGTSLIGVVLAPALPWPPGPWAGDDYTATVAGEDGTLSFSAYIELAGSGSEDVVAYVESSHACEILVGEQEVSSPSPVPATEIIAIQVATAAPPPAPAVDDAQQAASAFVPGNTFGMALAGVAPSSALLVSNCSVNCPIIGITDDATPHYAWSQIILAQNGTRASIEAWIGEPAVGCAGGAVSVTVSVDELPTPGNVEVGASLHELTNYGAVDLTAGAAPATATGNDLAPTSPAVTPPVPGELVFAAVTDGSPISAAPPGPWVSYDQPSEPGQVYTGNAWQSDPAVGGALSAAWTGSALGQWAGLAFVIKPAP